MNRREINQALAKALAYAECGKFDEAQRWGEVLIRKLEMEAVFKVGSVRVDNAQTLWTGGANGTSRLAVAEMLRAALASQGGVK